MKSRLSHIILSILILSLALQAFTLPVLAQPEPNESQAGVEAPIYLPESDFENMPLQLAAPYQRHSETGDRPEYIPPSREIIAKTKAQVSNFECTDDMDVPKIECQALVALYQSTNGAGWKDKSGWLQGTRVADWYGVTVGNGVVTHLNLSNNILSGSIPAALGNLSNLQGLLLYNNQLTGSIPAALGNLSNLQILYVENNLLSGSIPSTIGNLSNLQSLTFINNQLTGSIPSTLGNLSNLRSLYLDSNQLTGSIPSTLGKLSNLQGLYLYNNQLTGSIPAELGNLSNLQSLHLFNNQLTGSIPLSFVNLTILGIFDFSLTSLCEPATPEFLAWKNNVGYWSGTNVICEDELICLPLIFR